MRSELLVSSSRQNRFRRSRPGCQEAAHREERTILLVPLLARNRGALELEVVLDSLSERVAGAAPGRERELGVGDENRVGRVHSEEADRLGKS